MEFTRVPMKCMAVMVKFMGVSIACVAVAVNYTREAVS